TDRHFGGQRLVSPRVARDRKLRFPLLADFEPKGAAAGIHNAYRGGELQRAATVRDRHRGLDLLEPRLSGWRQSRGRGHSARAREHGGEGGRVMNMTWDFASLVTARQRTVQVME